MSFHIKNLADAASSVQAAPDAVHFDALVQGFGGSGVVSGCAVSANAGLQVAVASGVVMVAGAIVSVAGVNVTSAAAHATLPRFDMVVVDNAATVTIQSGTASATPAFPVIPANSVPLASLYIGPAQVTTATAQIDDMRVILLNTMAAGISTNGNTLGNTGFVTNRLILAGGSNVTLSGSTQSGSMTVTVVGPNVPIAGSAIADISTGTFSGTATSQFAAHDHTHRGLRAYNVQGVASTFFGNVQLSAGNNMALSTAGNTTAGSVAFHNVLSTATTVSGAHSVNVVGAVSSRFALEDHRHSGVQTISQWIAGGDEGPLLNGNPFGNSWWMVYPDHQRQYASASVADMFFSVGISSSSNSSHAGTITVGVAYYTANGSTLSSASSGSATYAWTNTSNNSTALLSGLKRLTVPVNVSMTPGMYWLAWMSATASANTNWFTVSNMLVTRHAAAFSGDFGAATAGNNQRVLGLGYIGASISALASRAFSDITGSYGNVWNPQLIQMRNLTKF